MNRLQLEYEIERLGHQTRLMRNDLNKIEKKLEENPDGLIRLTETRYILKYDLDVMELINSDLQKLLEIEKMIN